MAKQTIIEICEDARAEARAILKHEGSATLSFNIKNVTAASVFQSKGNSRKKVQDFPSANNDVRVLVFRVGS